jgi:GxxExxY protein
MAKVDLVEGKTTRSIVGAFYEVYNTLGFGFREHIYILALERELIARGHDVAREVCVTVWYKGEELGQQRLDMIVDGKVVVETKSTYVLPSGAQRQVLNYLRATTLEVGLLLHFGPEAKFYRFVCRRAVTNPRQSG